MALRARHVLFVLVPTVVVALLIAMTIQGESSLFERYELGRQAAEAREVLSEVERRNTKLVLELRNLERDPINVERAVAEELGWARPGTTLYHFDAEPDGLADGVRASAAVSSAATSPPEP